MATCQQVIVSAARAWPIGARFAREFGVPPTGRVFKCAKQDAPVGQADEPVNGWGIRVCLFVFVFVFFEV